jgi:hypothetical protein
VLDVRAFLAFRQLVILAEGVFDSGAHGGDQHLYRALSRFEDSYFFVVEGEDADAVAGANPGDALKAFIKVPSATFQNFTSPFQLPEASREPSGLKVMA